MCLNEVRFCMLRLIVREKFYIIDDRIEYKKSTLRKGEQEQLT